MKIMGRIIVILSAALVVIGAATALVGNSNSGFPDDRAASRPVVQEQSSSSSTEPEGLRPPGGFHEGERDAPSLFGIVDVIQNLVIMSLIVGLVTLGPRLKGVLTRSTHSFRT